MTCRAPLFLALAVMLGLPSGGPGAAAQLSTARIGLFGPAEPRYDDIAAGLWQGLREHGYVDATARILEARVPRGDRAAARAAIERLVREGVQVLFVIGSELARLAGEFAPGAPVVFLTPGDPVASGLVASLAHPGGNLTGMTFEYPELSAKRLEILREMAPRARRVLVLYDPRDASPRQAMEAVREAAPRLGLTLVEREAVSRSDIDRALRALDAVDAVLGIPGGFPSASTDEILQAAKAARRPTVFPPGAHTDMSALATYGISDAAVARQAARLVDKILKGARAGDLPVERPKKLDFVVNLRTARALGLTIPPALLLRADQLIE